MKKKRAYRIIAFFLLINIIAEVVSPTVAMALTSGPAQPEMSSFEPVSTSEMVDLFSGDFTYNIPLMDVEGYPININYQSNITMDQEASWVGLGWNINAGTINRGMRGIPDDFKGDEIKKELSMKENRSYGVSFAKGKEFTGFSKKVKTSRNVSFGINYNNYTGTSFELALTMGIAAGEASKFPFAGSLGLKSGADGLTISPRVSYSHRIDKSEDWKGSASIGTTFNSRAGLKALTLEASVTKKISEVTDDNGVRTDSKGGFSRNASMPISFGKPTYIPQINMPMKGIAVTLSYKVGTEVKNLDRTKNISGFFSQQKLAENQYSRKSYGYLNLQEAEEGRDVMLDYNREKDGPFDNQTNTLPLTTLTYDTYNVSGQGMGGTFRPYRNDIGFVYDHENSSNSDSYSLGVEIATPGIVKAGIDISITDVNSRSGQWNDFNSAKGYFKYQKVNKIPGFEPSYFKQAGELNVDVDPALYNNIRTEELVKLRLKTHSKFKHELTTQLEDNNGNTSELSSTNYRTARQNRNQNFSFISRAEYSVAAISKNLAQLSPSDPQALYGFSGGSNPTATLGHQIGEVTTVKPDGTRYVYGVACYNTKQKEVSFNISDNATVPAPGYNSSTGLVSYVANKDNTTDNKKGQDNFFSSTELPPYAHSYLLTSVLSADYVDITGDGPSTDDLGSYTLFKYKRTSTNYKWRIPYDANTANYNQNAKALPYDDQGNYLYGEKEIRFLDKIETKNYIAVFETAPRKDGLGAAGENGGPGPDAMHLLKKISLYTKPEYASGPTPDPIKVVNFLYDYSLCTGVPNNIGGAANPLNNELANQMGKLTLKSIYFTYSKSLKGKLSPYKFTYSSPFVNGGSNPSYNMKCYDRWGMYKANPSSNGIQNSDFPYSEQNQAIANTTSRSWQLEKIDLPSGGVINVDYESDDYAYVQDKLAMQMFNLYSIGAAANVGSPTPAPVSNPFSGLDAQTNVLYFKLKSTIINGSPASAKAEFARAYLKDITSLYFRANMRTVLSTYATPEYEYVSGYGEIFNYGLASTLGPNNYNYGWIQLKNVCRGDNKDGNCVPANPISKAAWLYARLHNPREALNFNNSPDPNLDPEDIIFGLVDIIANVIKTFRGVNGTLEAAGIGKNIDPSKSWIRLNNPDRKKLGGGSRVAQLTLNDSWASMFAPSTGLNQGNSSYGQKYSYTIKDPETGLDISSGVAQNEPGVGGDESPLKLPIAPRNGDKQEKLLAPDDFQYQEEPIGESLYPNASIGYSKVTVANIDYATVKRHATGKEVFSYYTAKDFPVIAQKSDLDPRRGKSLFGQLIRFDVKDFMTASQGFRVILNDMHGKLKSQFVYAEDKTVPISGTEYIYKTSAGQLQNSVTVINKNGSIGTKNVGVDFDFVGDFREQETETTTGGMQINLYFFTVEPAIPVLLPPIIPTFQRERVRFRSATVTKVINKYGLLDKTISYDLGSKSTTEYLAYDAITGDVLLTKTITSFDDNIYNIKYPAHFAYEGMSAAFKGTGAILLNAPTQLVNSTGQMSSASPYYQFVHPGDVYIRKKGSTPPTIVYAHKINNILTLVDANGVAITGFTSTDTLRVYRSGRRNMQSIPVQAITSFNHPLDANKDGNVDATIPFIDQNFGIIQSMSSEFSDQWKTFCECGLTPGSQKNPYLIGTLGNWRKKKDYTFLTTREQTKLNANSNIRKDGTFKEFYPFWSPAASGDWTVPVDLNTPSPKWTWVNEATVFSTNGFEMENKDALNRYSSAYLGYNYTMASAVVANSKYKQSGFDGFEDYDFRPCNDDHLGFKQYKSLVDALNAHTGRRSIKVAAGQSIIVTKVIENCP